MTPQQGLQFERGAEHLHGLGVRAVAEFLLEIGSITGTQTAILALLVGYRNRLNPAMLRAVGGDRFPHRRLRPVPPDMQRVTG